MPTIYSSAYLTANSGQTKQLNTGLQGTFMSYLGFKKLKIK